ncbi:DUF2382 domain-containing protein [Actinoplanes sp. TFC3]|uniref:DUF2382 domain-containing protein n=1 Tax=Actinoplanes sp. TFC3 TaxID=1710355 RepID=UPI00082B4B20|nr:PRC and DUF2382 domain-containing protein [Actinoplanes sp. TFC3]
MITQNDLQRIFNADAYDNDGDKIGSVGQVYLDSQDNSPAWVSIRTGLFGTKESFAPLQRASLSGDRLDVPFSKAQVKDAPRIDVDGDLSPAQEQELYTYYGENSGSTSGRQDFSSTGTGHDTSGPSTDTAMTRSEEHLVAGTRSEQAGKARLRKYVVTEQQSATVPVMHEEATLEREPITDATIGKALDGPEISEEEHELTLHAERPVVDTEAVPVERVRLNKQTVTEQETVSGEVRKEQIEFDDRTR